MTTRRQLAKVAYWLGRKMRWIRVPRRTYSWPEGKPVNTVPTWRWLPENQLSWKLEQTAFYLDRWHFDHWALVHGEFCGAATCADCGGNACGRLDLAHSYAHDARRSVLP